MRIHYRPPLILTAAGVFGALVAGCASGPPRVTTADVARAQTLVAEAERSGAQEYAPTDLQKARDEAQQADQLAGHGDATQADRLANEAAVDAKFATAQAANGKAQHDLRDQRRTLQTLRDEEGRQLQAPAGPPSGETPPSNGAQQPNPLQAVPPAPNDANSPPN